MKLTRNQQITVNNTLRRRDIDPSQQKHINCIRIHPTETENHFVAKCMICWQLYKDKHPFIAEVWTRDHKQRFDVLDLVDDVDIEIETGKSKSKTYKGDKVVNV